MVEWKKSLLHTYGSTPNLRKIPFFFLISDSRFLSVLVSVVSAVWSAVFSAFIFTSANLSPFSFLFFMTEFIFLRNHERTHPQTWSCPLYGLAPLTFFLWSLFYERFTTLPILNLFFILIPQLFSLHSLLNIFNYNTPIHQ